MIQKRRSSSADGSRWLAHTPNDTVHTNTVLQVSIFAHNYKAVYPNDSRIQSCYNQNISESPRP